MDMSKKMIRKSVANTAAKKAAGTAAKNADRRASGKYTRIETKPSYKTQGTIASVSIDTNNILLFSIDPVEPYDFPVKEKGETKQFILFRLVSDETNNSGTKTTKSANLIEKSWKVSADAKFSVLIKANELGNGISFGNMISLKQNRSKVELEVKETEFEKRDNDSSQTEISAEFSLSVSKLTIK